MKRCTQKWDHRDDQGASSEAINVSRQLIGVVGTGIYHSMAEVQAMVRLNIDSAFIFPLINLFFQADDVMHRSNNAVVMQTEQLGRIEALEEELRSSRGKMAELEQKMMEQDRVIAQLVGDNLKHLQDNMCLTAHINSSTKQMAQTEHRLGQVASVVMGFLEGRMEGLLETTLESSGSGGSDASGDNQDDQVSDGIVWVAGALAEVMRRDSPMPPTSGLIASMERDAEEAGLGGWFNRNLEDVPESWSGSNSGTSASQD